MQRVCERIVKRMFAQVLCGAFNSWAEHVEEKKKLNTAAQRVMARFLKADLTAAWNTWLETVREIKGVRRLMQRMLSSQLTCAFAQWFCWL